MKFCENASLTAFDKLTIDRINQVILVRINSNPKNK